uniref:C2 domain-containing protein n=1 Tax=Parascaris univalens TaxID=6257 RepID=A0A915B510_PARUN
MDRLAACHAMHGFLNVHAYRGKGCEGSHKRMKVQARSLSLADRRGHSLKKLNEMTMVLQAMDYDRFSSDDPIGEILLPMKHVKLENSPVYWKHLQRPTVSKESVGDLMLSLCYLPESNRLTVSVIKARDLPSKDKLGSSDPYVKLWLVQQGNKLEKRKTTVKPQTLAPIFNESFAFNVPSKEKLDKEVNLVATVMDYDMISTNDEIGHVIIGSLGSESGMRQWREILDHPETPMAGKLKGRLHVMAIRQYKRLMENEEKKSRETAATIRYWEVAVYTMFRYFEK